MRALKALATAAATFAVAYLFAAGAMSTPAAAVVDLPNGELSSSTTLAIR